MRITKNGKPRIVPMTPALRSLLERLKAEGNPQPTDIIISAKSARKCLETACRRLGFPIFTDHDFRHFFATTCIEVKVDIPTISRWLGHSDGGALAMRIYGHLREEHSRLQAQQVDFSADQPAPKNVVPLAGNSQACPEPAGEARKWGLGSGLNRECLPSVRGASTNLRLADLCARLNTFAEDRAYDTFDPFTPQLPRPPLNPCIQPNPTPSWTPGQFLVLKTRHTPVLSGVVDTKN